MFEFCQCLSAVAATYLPLVAIIGHSLGAAAAVFTSAGYLRLAPHKIPIEKLVLISMPSGVIRMTENFCRNNGGNLQELQAGLEREFAFSMADYEVRFALRATGARVLVIHDNDDEEVPVTEATSLAQMHPEVKLVLTSGAGHGRILASRETLRAITAFLA